MIGYNKKEVLGMSNSAIDEAVKIQGTAFDRKRKLSASTVETIKYLSKCGMSAGEIAAKLGISYSAARYNAMSDLERFVFNRTRNGKHYGEGNISVADRIEYKKRLVRSGAQVIVNK